MARSVFGRRGPSGEVSFNMTPMIDCVFQLIIFFILAGQVASQALARVELYRPENSQAQKWDKQDRNRVIVNVPSMAGPLRAGKSGPFANQALAYLVSGRRYEVGDEMALVEEFKRRSQPYLEQGGEFFVEIRADRRVSFADVVPILLAAAEADIPKMNITALLPKAP